MVHVTTREYTTQEDIVEIRVGADGYAVYKALGDIGGKSKLSSAAADDDVLVLKFTEELGSSVSNDRDYS